MSENDVLNLFCLPFAGGSKYSYKAFNEKGLPFLNIIALDYPGRGLRINEPFISNIDDLVNDTYSQISSQLDQRKYAIYGHSLGALMAYLLAKKIYSKNKPLPVHLFVTGTSGPASPSREKTRYHMLSKVEFIEKIRKLNGLPQEIFQNDELLDYFEPILRADFKVSETFRYKVSKPLSVPISVVTGTLEDMDDSDIKCWQIETKSNVDFHIFEGGHFFIFEHVNEIMQLISSKLFRPQ